ncbi:MAG: ATP-binding cassette domain-containing protein, partial [Elusimicrobia bacterium]|nr:ATP-binding cassette domain-containing protein [Elusimicrobiota bacterium]
MSDKPLLALRGAAVGYGAQPLLYGVDLEVNRGDFWGILGFNGSGKTALLKTLLGLLPVRGGRRAKHDRPRFGYVPRKERPDT